MDRLEGMEFPDDKAHLLPRLEDYFCSNFDYFLQKIFLFLPRVDFSQFIHLSDIKKKVSLLLHELMMNHTETLKNIIQSVCMDGVLPMDLEIELVNMTGEGNLISTSSFEKKRREEETTDCWLSSEIAGIKRQRIDFIERFKEKITDSLLQKYHFKSKEESSQHVRQMFVEPLIHKDDRNLKEKLKAKVDSGVSSGTEQITDSMKISNLFDRSNTSETHAVLLVGMPGTGKTMLTRRICYEWSTGELSQFTLTFLFEFRQLNLILKAVSLKELLFNLFLKPDGNPEEVHQYIIENPQRILIMFDGLDEFIGQISPDPPQVNPDTDRPVSISELFTCLLHGVILSGCTVVVTCRSKILDNIPLKTIDLVAEVLGFNQERVETYVTSFFHTDQLREKVLLHLRENTKLMHMCFVPALCHIVCICLEHLLQAPSSAQLPQTITQFYVVMLNIFIAKDQKSPKAEKALLKKFKSLITKLCDLALKGLDEKKTVFYVEDISKGLQGFAPCHGLLSVFDVKKMDSSSETGYSFIHLSSQEFFAALYLMISQKVTETALNKKLSLKSKWNLKHKTKNEITENFHIFLSGLSSKQCQSFLYDLAEHSEALIQKKQQTIIECLVKLAETQLTGPKLIELCHCTYETQDLDLARRIGGHLKSKYELRNFRIAPVDMTALSFIVNHGTCLVCLDFGGCPMELDCLEVLGKCKNLNSLSFRNKKYGDSFAQALSKNIAGMKTLQSLRLTAGRLTAVGAASLSQSFLYCPELKEISLQDNRLKTEDMVIFLELFSKMEQLKKLDLSNNDIIISGALALAKVAAKCPNITDINIRCDNSTAIFSSETTLLSRPPLSEDMPRKKEISLTHCDLTSADIQHLVQILQELSQISDINLSDNPIGDFGCMQLINSLPEIEISGQLSLHRTQISVEGLSYLVNSMVSCPRVEKVDIRFMQQTAAIHFLPQPATGPREIRIIGFRLLNKVFGKLCSIFQQCSHLASLDLSENSLENSGIKQITEVLPDLKSMRCLKLNGNKISMDGVIYLVKSFSSIDNMTDVSVSFAGSQKVEVTFQDKERPRTSMTFAKGTEEWPELPKTFSLTECRITAQMLKKLFHVLKPCKALTMINLSNNSLSCQMIENLLTYLQVFPNLTFLNISNNDLSSNSVLLLVNSVNLCNRIKEVDIRSSENICLHLEKQHKASEVIYRLTNYKIGKNDIEELMKVFRRITNLTEVNMRMNNIMEEGILVLLTSLSNFRTFTNIDACSQPKDAVHLTFAPDKDLPKKIRLAEYRFQADHLRKICYLLGGFSNLTHFISKNSNINLDVLGDFLGVLSGKPHDFIISIDEQWVRGQNVISLIDKITKTCANVGAIHINKHKVKIKLKGSGDSLHRSSVTCCEELVSLRLNHCELEEQHVSLLSPIIMQCTNLCELNFSNNCIGDEGVHIFSDLLISLPLLNTIVLESVGMSHVGMSHITEGLRNCISLQSINLSGNIIGEEGAIALANLLPEKRNLCFINISRCFSLTCDGGRQFIQGLSKCPELQEIYLDSVELDHTCLSMLCHGMLQMPLLQILSLSCNPIKDVGAKMLSGVLPSMKNLRTINLSQTNIGPLGALTVAKALGSCGSVEELLLAVNTFGDEAAEQLAVMLPVMHSLKVLNLQSCSLGVNGGSAFMMALASCQQIEDICLSGNIFGDTCLLEFARSLQHFTQLRKINLKLCEISDSVFCSLAVGFGGCKNLEEIILSWNSIGDSGAFSLAKALKGMRRLKKLDLERNQMTEQGAEAIAQVLNGCIGIKLIRLWDNKIPKPIEEKLHNEDSRLNFSFFE
ncbi:protein NLRC5-like isoform X1 [Xenopus laevis]|uniref:Protein NLRC5-like isoform X1 n=1 Tax=Xenopus laevis TaxID=8355 RepID=A0A8J1MXP7_XENLA|nr:protein NLRC5-like isoform X1 [Xenopus laevis]XP_041446079.1 protein NLRC5-like isoform X1 [Xenopus laevis]XP_041446080.1 protein NLRC5-like isoform X1 [Xenopus laevis]